MQNPELEAAIFADPENRENWAVYGDWLQSLEDPRGELIALELASKAAPQDEKAVIQERIQHIYRENRDFWAPNQAVPGETMPRHCTINWSYGFIDSLWLNDSNKKQGRFIEDMAESLFQQANLKFLQYLSFNAEEGKDYPLDFERVLKAMERARPFPILRVLDIYVSINPEDKSLCDLSPLINSYSGLETCKISTENFELGPLQNSNLLQLSIETNLFTEESFKNLAGADLPLLNELELTIWLNHSSFIERDKWMPFEPEWLAELFAARKLPELRKLTLKIAREKYELVCILMDSPLLKQLEELELRMEHGEEALTATTLLESRAQLKHLRSLRLTNFGGTSRELRNELEKTFGPALVLKK